MADEKIEAPKLASKRKRKAKAKKPGTPMGLMYLGPDCPRWGLVSRRVYPSVVDGVKLMPDLPDEAGDLLERHPMVRALFVHPEQLTAIARAKASPLTSIGPKIKKIYDEETS